MNRFTRRELAVTLSASAVLLGSLEAQTPAPAPPVNPQVSPDDELKAARAQLRDNADQLDKVPLSMAAEPATTFRP
jgi:hypothetical protein